jgi:gamma-glutamyltranspeptidase/glutathione hydrolase
MKALIPLVLLLLSCAAPGRAQGVVTAASPEAAAAGREILDAGGNAVDAAVAVAFSLAVTEPAMSGLGAGLQMLLMAPGGEPLVLNGTTFAPAGTPADADPGKLKGHRLSTIPTMVRTLDHAWRRHGSGRIRWEQLLAPAIRQAEEGFVIGPFRHKVMKRHLANLQASESARAYFLLPDGSQPAEGAVWKQPVLARTLRRLAELGADDFYRGAIARQIAADMAAHGGWITYEDLAGLPAPREQTALHSTYRGTDLYSLPPPCGGWVVLQILNLLERHPPEALTAGSPQRDRLVARALMTGHASRRREPVRDMINHEAETAERLRKDKAAELAGKESGETTHYTVVDHQGRCVAVTTSINSYFGAWVAAKDLGFFYNDYMKEFEAGPADHPFRIRPGAMPYSSMSATIAARAGRPVLALGSPGSARIISAVAQVAQRWLDGEPLAAAVGAARIHTVPPDRIYLEEAAAAERAKDWREKAGWVLQPVAADIAMGDRNAYFGGVHAVAWENGRWTGAADPRRDGAVALSTPGH